MPPPAAPFGGGGILGDIFGPVETVYVAPKTLWLPAAKGKGLELSGTFARRFGKTSFYNFYRLSMLMISFLKEWPDLHGNEIQQ